MEVRKVKSKTILKHALSWALTLAIVLAMLPAVTLPVKAAEADDPNAAVSATVQLYPTVKTQTVHFADLFTNGDLKNVSSSLYITSNGSLEAYGSPFSFEYTFNGFGFEIIGCARPNSMQAYDVVVDNDPSTKISTWVTSLDHPDWGFAPLPDGDRHLIVSTVRDIGYNEKCYSKILNLGNGTHTIKISNGDVDKVNSLYDLDIYELLIPVTPSISLNGAILAVDNTTALTQQYSDATNGTVGDLVYQVKAKSGAWGSTWTAYPAGGIDTSSFVNDDYDIRVEFAANSSWYASDASASAGFTVTTGVAPTFYPIDDITGIATTATAGSLKLNGTVTPANATNNTVVWSIKSAGTTGAYIAGNSLITAAAGTVVVTATIKDGTAVGTNFTKDFTIDITPPVVRGNDPNNGYTMNGWQGGGGRGAIFGYFPTVPGHRYEVGAWVTGGGQPWISVRANNVWDPTVTGDWSADPGVWKWFSIEYDAPGPGNLYGGVEVGSSTEIKWDCGYMGGETELTYFYGMSCKDLDTGEEIIPTDVATDTNQWTRWTMAGAWLVPGEIATSGSGMFITLTPAELEALFPTPRTKFISVTDLIDTPAKLQVGAQILFANVVPTSATIQNINWSIKNAGTTGATLAGNQLTTTTAGTVVLTATVRSGGEANADFTKDISIQITTGDPYAPDTTKPYVFNIPFMQRPGDIGSIYGGNLQTGTGAAEIAIQPLTGFTGTLDPATAAYHITAFNTQANIAQYEIPSNIPYDVYAIWVQNDSGKWSDVAYTNNAQIFWVSAHIVYPGQELTIMGKNMVNSTNRSADGVTVQFVPVSGGAALNATVTDITDYTVSRKHNVRCLWSRLRCLPQAEEPPASRRLRLSTNRHLLLR